MSSFTILFLNILVITAFISIDAKIGSIQRKPKKIAIANAEQVRLASTKVESVGSNSLPSGFADAESDLAMLSNVKIADQLDELAESLPLFANYLLLRSLEHPRAALSLSVKAAKDKFKHLSSYEKNRLFLLNCRPDVLAQLPFKLQYLIDQLSSRQINGVAQKFTSLSAAKFICNKMDLPKLDRFVEMLPKQKKEKVPDTKKTETDIHAKHIHQDTDIETGSGDL